eukprot:gnl/TRDRNA2_/TRDRNA2_137813_c0_seq1.p1 gnl/TRDRNA2_/TRDRNA2_137813_c0~~gnl/TRDRNA2_/TRDRNA2_137813_c0_seq1.p1  ORF type:complete len:110 (+),score=13.98 gnl/TRDRNA2_/TRDRNA2_137813_c0_seq1:320-649(+)
MPKRELESGDESEGESEEEEKTEGCCAQLMNHDERRRTLRICSEQLVDLVCEVVSLAIVRSCNIVVVLCALLPQRLLCPFELGLLLYPQYFELVLHPQRQVELRHRMHR